MARPAGAGTGLSDAVNPRGGIRLTPIDQPPAVRVSWSVHHRLYTDLRRGREALDVLDVMNLAISGILTSLGWHVISGSPGQPALIPLPNARQP